MTAAAHHEPPATPLALFRDRRSGRGLQAGGRSNYLVAVLLGAAALSALAAPTGAQTAPTVTGVTLGDGRYPGNGAGGAFIAGDRILVTITFSNSVYVTGAPRIALTIGGVTRYARYDGSGWPSTTPEFLYEVQSEDFDDDGISIGATALKPGDGTIREWSYDENGNDANLSLTRHTITDDINFVVNGDGADVRAPTVHLVMLQGCDRFIAGDVIQGKVTFTEPVAVTGTPRLALTIGDATRYADIADPPDWWRRLTIGSATPRDEDEIEATERTRALFFTYRLQSADLDAPGISIGATALERNGGTIRDAASLDADLSLTGRELLWWSRTDPEDLEPEEASPGDGEMVVTVPFNLRPAGNWVLFPTCDRTDIFPPPDDSGLVSLRDRAPSGGPQSFGLEFSGER